MSIHEQLRWGGLWIILSSVLMNGMNIVVYSGYHNATIQAIYGIGFTGLILSATVIHVVQGRRSGIFGLVAYLLSVLSLAFSNATTFLILAVLAGIEGAQEALNAIWDPVMRVAVYAIFVGWMLLGISMAVTRVFPRWAGILTALGVALQLPAQYAMDIAGPLFFLFTIGGSILVGAGLIWTGWALWSGKGIMEPEPGLSNLDRAWGAPLVMLWGLMLGINALINSIPELTLLDGIINLIVTATTILTIVILHSGQAGRAGRTGVAGFVFLHLGATLNLITAYFIFAQLAGQLGNNRALMASWVDIPVGRFGSYMLMLGTFLFGVSVIRAEVFPRPSGWLVVIGLALLLPSQFQSQDYLFSIFWIIGAILQGIGLGWMGWTLLRRRKTEQIVQLTESPT